jgi:hypothetical protein
MEISNMDAEYYIKSYLDSLAGISNESLRQGLASQLLIIFSNLGYFKELVKAREVLSPEISMQFVELIDEFVVRMDNIFVEQLKIDEFGPDEPML